MARTPHRRYIRRATVSLAKTEAVNALIDAFRTSRAVEFRHFVEQMSKIAIPSSEEFLKMKAEHRAETESLITAFTA